MVKEAVKIKAGELIEDFDLYPRLTIDSGLVKDFSSSLMAGEKLPPIIIEEKTKRIVDGFHRHRAFVRVYGEDAKMEVILKSYASNNELYLDALRYNGVHGKRIRGYEQTHAINKALNMKIEPLQIAIALGITKERIDKIMTDKIATIKKTSIRVPIKASVKKMINGQDGQITKEQAEAMEHLGGVGPTLHINQLILMLDNNLIDLTDDRIVRGLKALNEVLGQVLDNLN